MRSALALLLDQASMTIARLKMAVVLKQWCVDGRGGEGWCIQEWAPLSTRLRRSSRTATIFGGEISEVQNFSILGNRFSARGGSMLLAMFVCPSFPFQLRSRCGYSFGLARFNPLVRIGKLKDNISSWTPFRNLSACWTGSSSYFARSSTWSLSTVLVLLKYDLVAEPVWDGLLKSDWLRYEPRQCTDGQVEAHRKQLNALKLVHVGKVERLDCAVVMLCSYSPAMDARFSFWRALRGLDLRVGGLPALVDVLLDVCSSVANPSCSENM